MKKYEKDREIKEAKCLEWLISWTLGVQGMVMLGNSIV